MTDKPINLTAEDVRAVLREIDAPGTGKSQIRGVIKNCGDLPEFRGGYGDYEDINAWGWMDGETGDHIGIAPATDGMHDTFYKWAILSRRSDLGARNLLHRCIWLAFEGG